MEHGVYITARCFALGVFSTLYLDPHALEVSRQNVHRDSRPILGRILVLQSPTCPSQQLLEPE